MFLLQREEEKGNKVKVRREAGKEFYKLYLLTLFANTGETVQRKLYCGERYTYTHPDPVSSPLAASRIIFYSFTRESFSS